MRRAQSRVFHSLTLLRQDSEAGLFQQVDLAVFDVAVVQAAHAAEQVAEFARARPIPRGRGTSSGAWCSATTSRRSGESSHLSASRRPLSQCVNPRTDLLGFVKRNAFGARELEGGLKFLRQDPEVDDDADIVKQAGQIGFAGIGIGDLAGEMTANQRATERVLPESDGVDAAVSGASC